MGEALSPPVPGDRSSTPRVIRMDTGRKRENECLFFHEISYYYFWVCV